MTLLLVLLSQCEQRREALRAELAQTPAEAPALDQLSEARLSRDLSGRLGRWRDLLAADPQTAREALRALMPAERPILFVPEKDGYLLRGTTRLGALLFDDATPEITSARVATPRRAELIPGYAVLRFARVLVLLSGSRKRLRRAA